MPGDCVPSVLTFQSGYISGYLVVAAAATLHLQMTFAETEELRLWLRTQGWPTEASPVVQMLLPAVITTIWKKAGKKTEKGAGKWLYWPRCFTASEPAKGSPLKYPCSRAWCPLS